MEQSNDSHMETIVSTKNGPNTSSVSLLILNDDCLLEISKYLDLYGTISLAQTCRHLKSLAAAFMYRKFSKLTIEYSMYRYGETFINYILSHVGSYVVKLECNYSMHEAMRQQEAVNIWPIINDKCKHLQHIRITWWHQKSAQDFSEFTCFRNVNSLELNACNLNSNSNILASFRNLKHFSSHNAVLMNDLVMLLRNNRNLRSCEFTPVSSFFDFMKRDESWDVMDWRCLEMVPKLEALQIEVPRPDEYTILAKMKLKKLGLDSSSHGGDINQLLIQLDEHECLEELKLDQFLDVQSMNILKSKFKKLRRLVIGDGDDSNFDFHTLPILWPENLTELTVRSVSVSFEMFIATLRHLKQLERFDLTDAFGPDISDEEKFYDIDLVQREILKAVRYHHKLTVYLPGRIHGNQRGRSSQVC